MEHFQPVWVNLIQNTGDIHSVIKKYNQLGFNASNDLPTNAYWKELYENMESCKVIVTVRNSPDVWAKSVQTFFGKQAARFGWFMSVLYRLTTWGIVGKRHQNHYIMGL